MTDGSKPAPARPAYRASARPLCACGVRLGDAPLLSPTTGDPVCPSCHANESADAAPASAKGDSREALRHLALSLAVPKADPLLTRAGVCRKCGGITRVDSVREHIEDLPIGKSYLHVCTSCMAEFRTETIWASISRSLGATVLLGFAWLFWFSSGTRNDIIAALIALVAIAILARRVQRMRNRWFLPRRRRD